MSILIINHTTDKTFTFTLKKKLFTLTPGSKNIIDTDICPSELSKLRATGEVFVTALTEATLEFYKRLSATAANEEKLAKKVAPIEKSIIPDKKLKNE